MKISEILSLFVRLLTVELILKNLKNLGFCSKLISELKLNLNPGINRNLISNKSKIFFLNSKNVFKKLVQSNKKEILLLVRLLFDNYNRLLINVSVR